MLKNGQKGIFIKSITHPKKKRSDKLDRAPDKISINERYSNLLALLEEFLNCFDKR
jgi:hypothetical protein